MKLQRLVIPVPALKENLSVYSIHEKLLAAAEPFGKVAVLTSAVAARVRANSAATAGDHLLQSAISE